MYIVFVIDRDGGHVREEEYESTEEGLAQLKLDWPYAIYQGSGTFEAWAGGRNN